MVVKLGNSLLPLDWQDTDLEMVYVQRVEEDGKF
jgi:hypothetical protein